jgi:transcriptional regulator with XRE-family HTH domain
MPYKPDDKAEAEQLRRELGRRVRAAREAHGWSQEELAETIGVGAEMLSRYERGVKFPSHVTLVRLARALGSSTDALLGLDRGYYVEAPSGDLVRVVAKLNPTQQVAVASMIRELVSPGYRAGRR